MTTISTRLGSITGNLEGGVRSFSSVPYAKPPVGDRRFRAPEPHGPWDGTLDATRHRGRAIEVPLAEVFGVEPSTPATEDCLFVNIHTPAGGGGGRPVLFWIHGGSFNQGSGNDYDGSILAAQGDVVVVTVNYRLGLLGFLDLSAYDTSLEGSACNGLRDQILALEWVRDNIADYGGDAGCVTIFGESAGGASVNALLAAPAADGLYHRAIAHSGTAVPPAQPAATPTLAARLGVGEDQLLGRLRELPAEELLAAQMASGVQGGASIDGVVVTRDPLAAIAERGARGVPYIAGWNRDEGTLFTALDPNEAAYEFVGQMISMMVMVSPDTAAYREALSTQFADATPKERYERIWTDMFQRSSMRTAEAVSAAGPGGWLYRFDLPTTAHGGNWGATHCCEIPFTFNAFSDPQATGMMFHDREDPSVMRLSEAWSNTVLAFARTGDPNGAGLPEWPRYSATDRRAMILDAEPRIEDDPGADDRARWGDE